jgi:hypothetical protein
VKENSMRVLRSAEATERDQVGRAVGVVLLLGIALIHLLDAVNQFHEHKYVFVLYLLLMAGISCSWPGRSPWRHSCSEPIPGWPGPSSP